MLQELRRGVEPTLFSIRLEPPHAQPLERRRPSLVREDLPAADLFVNQLQHLGGDGAPGPPGLACLAQDLVEDHPVDGFGALHDREALLLSVPVLAGAIAVGGGWRWRQEKSA